MEGPGLRLGHISSFQYHFTICGLELQRTWFSKLCQNGICITDTRNLNIDTVGTFLVNLSLSTVAFYTLLKFVYSIFHITIRYILAIYFICNTNSTCKV